MRQPPAPGLRTLLADGLRHGGDLFSQEMTLLRQETDGNIRAILGLTARFGTVAMLVLAALVSLLVALVKTVAALTGSDIIASLIVGTPFAGAAVALMVLGLRRMSRKNLYPRRFERQVEKDVEMVARS
ncbi:phage holin family protein [Methylobacterium sp. BTF04]|uniref:phage holin family protein n=1 Tax=Methylobacterium sp. BTF04 TaxID=2708300 RepID=UPI0013D45514|nr:phage holin family protein [Methylobacterium sp. BTF04]NEU11898.1 phage holin family protein [Methylobacterium sp. BTF04]